MADIDGHMLGTMDRRPARVMQSRSMRDDPLRLSVWRRSVPLASGSVRHAPASISTSMQSSLFNAIGLSTRLDPRRDAF